MSAIPSQKVVGKRRRRGWLKRLGAVAAGAGIVAGTQLTLAPNASASEDSCATFNTVTDIEVFGENVPIYQGMLCMSLSEQSFRSSNPLEWWRIVDNGVVTALRYDLYFAGDYCDWWVDFDFRNAEGQVYLHSQGARQGCFSGSKVGRRVGPEMAVGSLPMPTAESDELCATLYHRKQGVISTVVSTCTHQDLDPSAGQDPHLA